MGQWTLRVVSALLALFPASWANKIAPKLHRECSWNAQKPQGINIACPKRSCDETPVEGAKQVLQAVKFAAKNMPGFRLGLDEDFQMAGCFQELIHGYTTGLVEPYMMRGLQPLGPSRTTLKLSVPLNQGSHPRAERNMPHCAHLIGLPTTVYCDCGIRMGASIKRKRDSGINCRTVICLLSGQCISRDLQIVSYSSNMQFM